MESFRLYIAWLLLLLTAPFSNRLQLDNRETTGSSPTRDDHEKKSLSEWFCRAGNNTEKVEEVTGLTTINLNDSIHTSVVIVLGRGKQKNKIQ